MLWLHACVMNTEIQGGGAAHNLNYDITSVSLLRKLVRYINEINGACNYVCILQVSAHTKGKHCVLRKAAGGSDQMSFPVRKLRLQTSGKLPHALRCHPSVTTDQPLTQFQNQSLF